MSAASVPDPTPEEHVSLDPADWSTYRQLAHEALDDALDLLQTVRERPLWQPVPAEVRNSFRGPAPREGAGAEAAYQELRENILPYATGNIHPRFFGWVHGSGLASGVISGMIEAAMNSNCGGRDHGALYVERCVIDWCKEFFGYPASASGVLVGGTSMATLLGLAVARHVHAGCDVRKEGLPAGRRLVAYASSEAHESARKAMELLGLGSDALRSIPVDGAFRMRVDLLEPAIEADCRAGLHPFCVIGSAGTVNTGGIDDLDSLATICRRHGLWFHIDGAFGALCVLDDELRSRVRGIERSDSVAFDFHKWMHVPYDAGCVLVRNGDLHRQAFSTRPVYLQGAERGLAGGGIWPCEYGVDLSRGFRALKIWFALKEHGSTSFGLKMRENCRQAVYLADLVRRRHDMELLAEPTLNIVCFRYIAPDITGDALDALNRDIVADLQEAGIAAPSTTRLNGCLAIRCCITNHRSTTEDLGILVDAVAAAAQKRLSGQLPQRLIPCLRSLEELPSTL